MTRKEKQIIKELMWGDERKKYEQLHKDLIDMVSDYRNDNTHSETEKTMTDR